MKGKMERWRGGSDDWPLSHGVISDLQNSQRALDPRRKDETQRDTQTPQHWHKNRGLALTKLQTLHTYTSLTQAHSLPHKSAYIFLNSASSPVKIGLRIIQQFSKQVRKICRILQRMKPFHNGTRKQEPSEKQQIEIYTHIHTFWHEWPWGRIWWVHAREVLSETTWAMLASWATQMVTHIYTHRVNSVSCGNINVSSFMDDYSQQERGISLMTKTATWQEGGNKADF